MSATTGFSLLMPVYAGDNADYFVRAFFSSVQEQTLRPNEVVLVEDGPVSAAMTAAIERLSLESPVSVTRVKLPENVGLALALEAGLARCTHDVVARMDADDINEATRFAEQLAVIEQGYDLVGTGLVEFAGHENNLGATRIPPTSAEDISRSARLAQPFHHPTVMYRKAAVAAAGGYQDIGPMEDYWLFARMIHAGAKVTNLAKPLVRYRVSAGAYARRGGVDKLRTELTLQRHLRELGFTTRGQYWRNVIVRGGYRLVPEAVRRRAYRRLIANRFVEDSAAAN